METFALAAAALAAASAFIVGARRIVGLVAAFARRQDRIDQVLVTVHHELTDGDNGSLKSQVVGMGERQVKQGVKIDHVQDTIDSHIDDLDLHNRNPSAHK